MASVVISEWELYPVPSVKYEIHPSQDHLRVEVPDELLLWWKRVEAEYDEARMELLSYRPKGS